MAKRSPEVGGGQGERTGRHPIASTLNRWFGGGEPRRRQNIARGRCQSTTGIWQLVLAASHAEAVGRQIHNGMCGFSCGANDDQVDAWSQGAKRLLHFRAEVVQPTFISPYQRGGEYAWMG